MQLSQETYRARWLILVTAWVAAAWLLFAQAGLVKDYLDLSGQMGLRGRAPSTPMTQTFPAFAADAQTWIRHALALSESKDLRLRYTMIDNAPHGREVHWNSGFAWVLVGAGRFRQLFTGEAFPAALERSAVWVGPTLLLALTILFSAWITRRAGAIAGVLVVVVMTCHDRIYEGFFPSYVDHHGLLTVAAFGTVLGAVCMGAGWWQPRRERSWPVLPDSPEAARSGAWFSALSGACGMWVSAASIIPPIALVGISGFLAILFQGRSATTMGSVFYPQVWRLWGRVGAGASVFFYLLEYFPSNFGLRLEANHPFHALAWLAGGELIAQFGERWLAPREERWANLSRLAWPLIAVCVVPLTIAIGGALVFAPLDPFMSRLHNEYIQEFLPLWKTIRGFGGRAIFQALGIDLAPLLIAVAALTYFRRETPVVLWFATIAAFFFTAMAWWQSRWLLNASAAQVSLALVVFAFLTMALRPRARWIAVAATLAVFFLPSGVMRYTGSLKDLAARRVSPPDAMRALARDIATQLRASQPSGEIVLLTNPNGSTDVGYYGQFKTLGTLYWENGDGLKAAAGLFSAQSHKEAATMIRQHGVTHIAIISKENFIAQYFELLNPKGTSADLKKAFGYQLLMDKVVPQWLQMLPYKVPDDLTTLDVSVLLFKVNFKQTVAEAIYNVAIAQTAGGFIDEADQTLNVLLNQAPQLSPPWLRKGELLMVRRNWDQAAEHFLRGISLAPAAERSALYAAAAEALYGQGQHALAVRVYRASLADRPTADVACYLAWVLATSKDDSLRNGKEALHLAQEALKTNPTSATFLITQGAAFAENGKFAEAAESAERAVVNARLRNDAKAAAVAEQRLATFQAGKPIRE